MEQTNFSLSVLLCVEEGTYVAQCLEYDIAAQGRSLHEAMQRFQATFVAHITLDLQEGRSPLCDVQRAPDRYWEQFEKAEPLARPMPLRMPMDLPADVAASVPKPWMIRATAQAAVI